MNDLSPIAADQAAPLSPVPHPDAAGAIIPRLPADCRRAVTAAHDLFTALSRRLRRSGGTSTRVRVPNGVKLGLAARATVGAAPLRAGS